MYSGRRRRERQFSSGMQAFRDYPCSSRCQHPGHPGIINGLDGFEEEHMSLGREHGRKDGRGLIGGRRSDGFDQDMHVWSSQVIKSNRISGDRCVGPAGVAHRYMQGTDPVQSQYMVSWPHFLFHNSKGPFLSSFLRIRNGGLKGKSSLFYNFVFSYLDITKQGLRVLLCSWGRTYTQQDWASTGSWAPSMSGIMLSNLAGDKAVESHPPAAQRGQRHNDVSFWFWDARHLLLQCQSPCRVTLQSGLGWFGTEGFGACSSITHLQTLVFIP